MAEEKNYITPSGHQKLLEELRYLLNTERPKIVDVVSWAASNGDRSENGDYIYGKRRLREIDKKIHFLTKRLEIAAIVDPTLQKSDSVKFGATVCIENETTMITKKYQIVGVDEIEVSQGKISWISPLGKSLLSKKVGDTVFVNTPKGEETYTILSIEYI